MKKLGSVVYLIIFLLIAAALVLGIYLLANNYLLKKDKTTKPKTVTCQKLGVNHLVIIKNNQANPKQTNGKLCDTMTISNQDNQILLMAFGPHEHHVAYDGITERILDKGQSLTVTYNQAGNFQFHDHIGDVIRGTFSVAN